MVPSQGLQIQPDQTQSSKLRYEEGRTPDLSASGSFSFPAVQGQQSNLVYPGGIYKTDFSGHDGGGGFDGLDGSASFHEANYGPAAYAPHSDTLSSGLSGRGPPPSFSPSPSSHMPLYPTHPGGPPQGVHHSRASSLSSVNSSQSSAHSSGSLGRMMIESGGGPSGDTTAMFGDYVPSSLSHDAFIPSSSSGNANDNSLRPKPHRKLSLANRHPPYDTLQRRSSGDESYGPPATHSRSSSVSGFGMDLGGRELPRELVAEADKVKEMSKTGEKEKGKMHFAHTWLKFSYALSENATVSRQALFHSYNVSCKNLNVKAINSASFGKAVRQAFVGIKTRRLGVRGNSKYHYCGMRPNSEYEIHNLASFGEGAGGTNWSVSASTMKSAMSTASGSRSGSSAAHSFDGEEDDDDFGGDDDDKDSGEDAEYGNDLKRSISMDQLRAPGFSYDDARTPTAPFHPGSSDFQPSHSRAASSSVLQSRSRRQVASGPSFSLPRSNSSQGASKHAQQPAVTLLPGFPHLSEAGPLPANTVPGQAARSVWAKFTVHMEALLDSVKALKLDQFEMRLRSFWAGFSPEEKDVCHSPSLAGIVARAETIVFDEILENLKSRALSPLPTTAISALRNLAQNLEQILVSSLDTYGATFVEPKVELGARFGHLLLRFLDIYQISNALSSLLNTEPQVHQMLDAWNKINFDSIRNHVALVCNCRHEQLVQILEVELRDLFHEIASVASQSRPEGTELGVQAVRRLMDWADATSHRLLERNRSGESGGKGLSPRSILIRWSFVTSEVMRDLTIRSDPCFGAFQILKIAFDEWVAFKILRLVALSTASVAASVDAVTQQQFFSMDALPEDYQLGGFVPTFANGQPDDGSSLMYNEAPGGMLFASAGAYLPSSTPTFLATPYQQHQTQQGMPQHHPQPPPSSTLSDFLGGASPFSSLPQLSIDGSSMPGPSSQPNNPSSVSNNNSYGGPRDGSSGDDASRPQSSHSSHHVASPLSAASYHSTDGQAFNFGLTNLSRGLEGSHLADMGQEQQ